MTTVLILSPMLKGSGNYASVCRLRCHFEKHDWQTRLASPDQFLDKVADMKAYVETNNFSLVLGVHAYKSGQLLAGLSIPYCLVLGGTDLNNDSKDEHKLRVMTEAVRNARFIIGFGESMLAKFFELWPDYNRNKTSIIPQGVTVYPSYFNIKKYIGNILLKSKDCLQLSNEQPMSRDHGAVSNPQMTDAEDIKIFLIAGGIRPVKDPLLLVKPFSDWRERCKRFDCIMLFIGPVMDQNYYEKFTRAIHGLPGVLHIPTLDAADMHAAIADSFALVNSSESEGMSLAILEAMCLKTPAIVRDIPANTALVTDGSTGLVYKTGEEFLDKIEMLLGQPDLVDRITQNAQEYVSQHHSPETEEKTYVEVMKKLLCKQDIL